MKEYWFMNSKSQFERHLQFTARLLLQQSHGFLVLIIPCYHAGTIKEANINNRTGRLRTVLFKYFINASSMHSSMHRAMHHQRIHQCIINAFIIAFINASSMRHQCITNVFIASNASISFIQFLLSSSVHRQCIYQCITNVLINVFINASSINAIHQCIINASLMHSPTNHQAIVSAFVNASSMHSAPLLLSPLPPFFFPF